MAQHRVEHRIEAVRASRRADLLLFVASVALAAIPTVAVLAQHGGDPSALLRIGDRSASRSFVEPDFSHPVVVPGFGHDGQQFYVIARTIPHLQRADGHVDRLVYRARRILFPLLVAVAPAGAPTVWAMLAVNLAAIGFAGVGIGRLALRLGVQPFVGLAVAVTPALFMSARASLSDALAFSLAVWGVVLWHRHLAWAALLFTLAALTREVSLVAPAACAVAGLWEQRHGLRRSQLVWLAVPFVAYATWAVGLALALHPSHRGSTGGPVADLRLSFDLPFRAWFEIGLTQQPVLLGMVLTLGSLAAAYTLREQLPEVALWLLAEGILLAISSPAIAAELLNYCRVAPLAVPALALAIALQRRMVPR